MANGKFYVHVVDGDTSAGELIPFCPGGLTALAGTRQMRGFAVRQTRAHTFISAALDRTGRIVSALPSR